MQDCPAGTERSPAYTFGTLTFVHQALLPAKCQQMHFTGYLIAVPVYPVLYTYGGMFPDSFLARHTQSHPAIPEEVHLADAPTTWWSLVETVSWDAWVTPHVPHIMPECNLKPPEISALSNG